MYIYIHQKYILVYECRTEAPGTKAPQTKAPETKAPKDKSPKDKSPTRQKTKIPKYLFNNLPPIRRME